VIAVDASAIVAVARCEPGHARIEHILGSTPLIVGVPTLAEAHLVLSGRHEVDATEFIDALAAMPNLEVVALAWPHFHAARDAFDRFGKGRGHPAQLNFGDCLSYAVAKVAGVPLLFVGDDFPHTDIAAAF
jgi:ribonuclease VapC